MAIEGLKNIGISKSSVKTLFKPDTVNGYVFNWLTQKTEQIKQNLIDADKQASSKLLQSIRFKPVETDKGSFTFDFIMQDYWIHVNDGRPPGKMPPIKPIVDWIFNKPSFKAKIGGTRKGLKGMQIKKLGTISAPANILAAAFGIAKKISKQGIEPTNFFTDVINDKAIQELKQELKKAFKRDIEIALIDVAKETRELNKKK